MLVTQLFFFCPTLVSCWSIHLSHFIIKLKICHLYQTLITTHDDFNSAALSSMPVACHIWIQFNGLALSGSSSVVRVSPRGHGFDTSQGLRFFLSHACVMLISSPFISIILDLMSYVYRNSHRRYYWYFPETGGKPLPSSFIKCNQFIAWCCKCWDSSSQCSTIKWSPVTFLIIWDNSGWIHYFVWNRMSWT